MNERMSSIVSQCYKENTSWLLGGGGRISIEVRSLLKGVQCIRDVLSTSNIKYLL